MKITDIILSYGDICSLLADVNFSLHSQYELDRTTDKKWTKEEIEKQFEAKLATDVVCYEDKLTADLLSGESIILVDMLDDNEEECVHTLSLKDFVDGTKILANRHPGIFGNFLALNADIDDTDAYIQCVAFGDIING